MGGGGHCAGYWGSHQGKAMIPKGNVGGQVDDLGGNRESPKQDTNLKGKGKKSDKSAFTKMQNF